MSRSYPYKLVNKDGETVFAWRVGVSNWLGPPKPERVLEAAEMDVRMFEKYPNRVPIIPDWSKLVVEYESGVELTYENVGEP